MLRELLQSARELHHHGVISEEDLAAIEEICHSGDLMTVPCERTRALIQTKEMLQRLLDPKETPRVPAWLRGHAAALLRHYPTYADIERAHKALPEVFGPVPPFSRLSGSATTPAAIDGIKDSD